MAISTDNHQQRGEVVKPIVKEHRFTESEKKKKNFISTPTNPRLCLSSRDLSDSNQISLLIEHHQQSSANNYIMQGTEEAPGLMRLSMSKVLSMCQIFGFSARISYYEVYMDSYLDLLQPKTGRISVWDDKDGKVQVRGLSTVLISSMVDFDKELSSGIKRKKVIPTQLNDGSSRSHGVLAILVTNGDDSAFVTIGKLNLVNLAGNGDIRRTCSEGIRVQESGKINQSLLALSNVMSARSDKKSRVPYRDNKLTRILQDSLGGSSMVVCLNQGLASPCSSRPPIPMSSLKKERLYRSSGKPAFAIDGESLSKDDSNKHPVVVSFGNVDGSKTFNALSPIESTANLTPLDRFSACTSNMKTTLKEEYIAVLNTANKDQLMKLKGIGPKRAEAIINLRAESPIEALSDLQKAGLSSKLANGLFGQTGKALFD